jgi:hypothetical protein
MVSHQSKFDKRNGKHCIFYQDLHKILAYMDNFHSRKLYFKKYRKINTFNLKEYILKGMLLHIHYYLRRKNLSKKCIIFLFQCIPCKGLHYKLVIIYKNYWNLPQTCITHWRDSIIKITRHTNAFNIFLSI